MHVEDTRNGLLKYIKSRWAIIRDGGGFDALEPWCLKELADGKTRANTSNTRAKN